MAIKAIIFDVGGVLVHNQVEDSYRLLAEKLGIDKDKMMAFYSRNKVEIQNGQISTAEFIRIIEAEFGVQENFLPKWRLSYMEALPINEPMVDLAQSLVAKYRVGAISNNPKFLAEVDRQRRIFKNFDTVVWSCDVGHLKPEKVVFEIALKRLGVKAKECVFIEDRTEILDVPKNLGITTILFKDKSDLLRQFDKLDIEY